MATRHRGEGHHKSKLTWDDVHYIREHTEESNAAMGRRFGVGRSTIRLIRENVTWHDPEFVPSVNPFRGSGYKEGMRPPGEQVDTSRARHG